MASKAYEKTDWKDHIVDSTTGKILQQGTPVSASKLNHIEEGIDLAHQKMEGANRQTVNISHGVQVINGDVDAPVSLQMEGRTLIPLQNTELDAAKYYVLADKKTKLKFSDSFSVQGVTKFPGVNAKVQAITRTANFENKVQGSTLENPHIIKTNSTKLTPENASLLLPTNTSSLVELSTGGLASISKLDGILTTPNVLFSGGIAQVVASINVYEEVQRFVGKIPRNVLVDAIAWLKDNIQRVQLNAHASGSGPAGSTKLYARVNNMSLTAWEGNWSITTSTISKLSALVSDPASRIDASGYIHFNLFADASDGITPSMVNLDYLDIDIELKSGAILHLPRIPLYEVTKEHYDNILVTWNEDEVMRRYPAAEGVQHLQNPYVIAEGENLLPPFSEWTLNGATTNSLNGAYDITVVATAQSQSSIVDIKALPGQKYNIQCELDSDNARVGYSILDANGNQVSNYSTSLSKTGVSNNTIIVPANGVTIRIYINMTSAGTFRFKNIMLSLGEGVRTFVPKNPSYLFAETKLGAIGTTKDLMYDADGKMMTRKAIEKDFILDGSLSWYKQADLAGFKMFNFGGLANPMLQKYPVVMRHDGALLKSLNPEEYGDSAYINSAGVLSVSVPHTLTGFTDASRPVADEVKAVFNGWKAKTLDTNNKPTAWISIVDGTDAPTQTLAYVAANKATGYIPYKLSYVLAPPQLIEAKIEGAISVNGLTQVEVGSGVIVRERVTPVKRLNENIYYINVKDGADANIPNGSKLKNKSASILAVYKNNKVDKQWSIIPAHTYGHGIGIASISGNLFDTEAEYYVTYIVYDRNQFTINALTATATFANNIRAALDDGLKSLEDTKRDVSVQSILMFNVLARLKAGGL